MLCLLNLRTFEKNYFAYNLYQLHWTTIVKWVYLKKIKSIKIMIWLLLFGQVLTKESFFSYAKETGVFLLLSRYSIIAYIYFEIEIIIQEYFHVTSPNHFHIFTIFTIFIGVTHPSTQPWIWIILNILTIFIGGTHTTHQPQAQTIFTIFTIFTVVHTHHPGNKP